MCTMVAMPKTEGAKSMPVSIRLEKKLRERLIAIGKRGVVEPPLSSLIIAAVREFVEKHDPQQRPTKPK